MGDLCPLCAGELSPGVRKCRHCGEWLPGQSSGASPSDELAGTVNRYLRAAPKAVGIYVIISLVIFVVAAFLMFRWYSSESEQMHRDYDQKVNEMHRDHDQRVNEMRGGLGLPR